MGRIKGFVIILSVLFVIVTLLSLLIPSKVATVNGIVIYRRYLILKIGKTGTPFLKIIPPLCIAIRQLV
jgi:hypothetical protein